MAAFELRPRSPSEIVDASLSILRQNYLTLTTIAAVVQLPVVAAQMAIGPEVPTLTSYMSDPGPILLLLAVAYLAILVEEAAIIATVSDIYLGKPVRASSAFARTGARIFSLIGGNIARLVVSVCAFVFFYVPGVYVYLRLVTLPAIVVVEQKDAIAGFNRAWALGKDRVGASLLGMGLGWILYLAISLALTLLTSGLSGSIPLLAQPAVRSLIERVASVFLFPFVGVVTTLVYYDLRVRKEAFDLEVMVSELIAAPVR